MRKTFIAILAFALPAAAISAQDSPKEWTLQECIDHAIEHNIELRQQELALKGEEIQLNSTKGERLPGIQAATGQNFSFGRGLTENNTYSNTNTTSTSFSIGGSLPVFNGLSIRNSIKEGELNLKASTAELESAREDISVRVAQAYVQILYDTELLHVAENQIRIDSLQVERLVSMFENGKASASEVAQQKASLGNSRMNATQARGSLKISLLELSQLLELSSPENFSVQIPDTGIDGLLLENPESIFERAVAVKPSVRADEFKLDASDFTIKIAKAAFLPSISLDGGLGTNYYTANGMDSDTFMSQIRHNFSQYLGLSLSIPVFNGHQSKNQVRLAKLQREIQTLQLESTKKALYKEIQEAYYNAVNAQEQYRSSLLQEESAKEAFDLVLAKYENGKADITEFNEAKNLLLGAESDLSRARYEYLFSAKLLDFYAGKPLTL